MRLVESRLKGFVDEEFAQFRKIVNSNLTTKMSELEKLLKETQKMQTEGPVLRL